MSEPQEATQDPQPEALVTIPEHANIKSLVLRTVRSVFVAAAAIMLLMLILNVTGLSTGILLGDMSLKPPTEEDNQNAKKAADENNTGLCGNISDEASLARPFEKKGRQAAFLKSECYFGLALKMKDDMACVNVRPVVSGWLDGSFVTPERCMGMVRASRNRAGLPLSGGSAPAGLIGAKPVFTAAKPLEPGSKAAGPNGKLINADGRVIDSGGSAGKNYDPATFDGGNQDAATAEKTAKSERLEKEREESQQKYLDAWSEWKRTRKAGGVSN